MGSECSQNDRMDRNGYHSGICADQKDDRLRADAADEIMGMDRSEHGRITAYSGFSTLPDGALAEMEEVPVMAKDETSRTAAA